MTAFCVFFLWAISFWAHESLQSRTLKLFPASNQKKKTLFCLRVVGPLLGLFLCLHRDVAYGLLYWFGLGSMAGISISLLMVLLKQKRGTLH